MTDKIDELYTKLMNTSPEEDAKKRSEFKNWFVRNDMGSFILIFLENNLNIEATARKSYLAKSTVRFRLNRIKQFTGCDIRTFYGAMHILTTMVSCGIA